MKFYQRIFTSSCFLAILGCATTYETTAVKSWDLMKKGKTDEALKLYESEVTESKDRLLKLMDEGVLFRVAGRFEESNQKFFEAARIIEENGYLSLGEQAVTLVSNEKQTVYQGEDFEKVLIHLYLGLNFLSMNQYDEALVETRRVNEILYKMISEAKRPYELNAFARYLGANLFENDGNENDALVAYKSVVKIDPKVANYFPVIKDDLIRMAKLQGMDQELEEYKKQFGQEVYDAALKSLRSKDGALLFLFETGKSPRKYSSREQHTKPGKGGSLLEVTIPVAYYEKRPYQIASALLEINGHQTKTSSLNSVEATAIAHLKDRMGRAVAKALLTAGVKVGIAAGVGAATNSKELGFLTGLALILASEADTRSWLLLPAELQAAKIFLPAGTYDLQISYLNSWGQVLEGETLKVTVKSKRITFLQRRKFL